MGLRAREAGPQRLFSALLAVSGLVPVGRVSEDDPMSTSETHAFPRTSTARVTTERPARYGKQLAGHMGHKITAVWDEENATGSLEFNREGPTTGIVELSCDGEALVLRLSTTEEHLERLEEVVGIHLARFGAKQGMVVRWDRGDGTPGTTQGPVTPGER